MAERFTPESYRPAGRAPGENLVRLLLSKSVGPTMIRSLCGRDRFNVKDSSSNEIPHEDRAQMLANAIGGNIDRLARFLVKEKDRNWMAVRRLESPPQPAEHAADLHDVLLGGPGIDCWTRVTKKRWLGRIVSGQADGVCVWFITAHLVDEYVSFEWRNPDRISPAHWARARDAMEAWAAQTRTHLLPLPLEQIVMHTWWDAYRERRRESQWEDRAIYAKMKGLALRARVSGGGDEDEGGDSASVGTMGIHKLEAISRVLAASAMGIDAPAVGQPGSSELEAASDRVLSTMLRDWGPRSYEIRFDAGEVKFAGNFYFGSGDAGQDAFQHIRCAIKDFGGTAAAREVVVNQARLFERGG